MPGTGCPLALTVLPSRLPVTACATPVEENTVVSTMTGPSNPRNRIIHRRIDRLLRLATVTLLTQIVIVGWLLGLFTSARHEWYEDRPTNVGHLCSFFLIDRRAISAPNASAAPLAIASTRLLSGPSLRQNVAVQAGDGSPAWVSRAPTIKRPFRTETLPRRAKP